jgi:hypothetical protein
MNKNTRAKKKLASKEKTNFHGKPCITSFAEKEKNPENKRRSPWKGAKPGGDSRG